VFLQSAKKRKKGHETQSFGSFKKEISSKTETVIRAFSLDLQFLILYSLPGKKRFLIFFSGITIKAIFASNSEKWCDQQCVNRIDYMLSGTT
jgi:hypothetical protein